MELLITVLGFDPKIPINGYEFQIVKAIASIFVVLANYLVGKYWVFQASQSN